MIKLELMRLQEAAGGETDIRIQRQRLQENQDPSDFAQATNFWFIKLLLSKR